MAEQTILQRAAARAEERRSDSAFLRSIGVTPIEDDATETPESDDSPSLRFQPTPEANS